MTRGIYIDVHEPVVLGTRKLFTIRNFSDYSHNIAAIGGFWDASIGLSVRRAEGDDWVEQGLGRQIRVYNDMGGQVWRGFVNQVTLGAGGQTFSIGPLMDIVNRACAVYTPREIPTDGGPPVDGTETVNLLTDDAVSQARYGVLESSVAAGAVPEALADMIRDAFIFQYRFPKTTGDLNIPGTGDPVTITLDCLGNVNWLNVFPYNNLNDNVITASDKLKQVLAANTPINPGAFSTDYNYIIDNMNPMSEYEDKGRKAWDVINEILSLGNDSDDTRSLFGFYEDDKPFYNAAPTTIEYEYRVSSQFQRVVQSSTKVTVAPWNIRPGKWIRTPDLMVGRIIDTADFNGDPRNKFIENVNFTAPDTVSITGSPYDTLAQMLSKITYLGGVY